MLIQCHYLDNMKAPWELLEKTTEYYEKKYQSYLTSICVEKSSLKVLNISSPKNSRKDVYRLVSLMTEYDSKKTVAEVMK